MSNDASTPDVTPSTPPSAETDEHRGRPVWLTTALVGIAALLLGAGGALAVGQLTKGSGDDHHHAAASPTAVGFAQDMIVHHQQAVEMTQIVIERGSDPTVRDLAVTMLTDQNKEIGQMTGWLQAWGAPLQNPGAPMSWMNHGPANADADHCADGHVDEHCPAEGHGHHEHGKTDEHGHGPDPAPAGDQPVMDGMATDAEMARLRSLSGPAVDTYFLQLMLRHHEGGHHMMTMVIDPKGGAPDYVRTLAERMDKAQSSEESTMKQLLAQRNAKPLR
ncbi:DUF305 domain-containing protein [Gordonia araii]|nr:DUF305 domain-containing protein [Gordonia araii]NNG98603.1 DUF305 domain-containing protein [Gordonia araii NBRC 100433]